MAIDLAGFITYLKDHAVDHGFHVHDERHFIETFSLRQAWEIDMHPESACDGPVDLNVAFDIDPRDILRLEDEVAELENNGDEPTGEYTAQLLFNWGLPALAAPPDLIVLSAELAGVAGIDLPVDVSEVDTFGALDQQSLRRLSLVGRFEVSLVDVMYGREKLCDVLDRAREVSEHLVEAARDWKVVYLDEE
jgi:hypothetical protein